MHFGIKAELHMPSILTAPKIFYAAPAVYEQDRRSANRALLTKLGERILNRAWLETYMN